MTDFWQHVLGKITPEEYEQRKVFEEVRHGGGMIIRKVKYDSTLDYLESKGCTICWEPPPNGDKNSREFRIILY